jgi:hypothetical protein
MQAWPNSVIDSTVLYMAIPHPPSFGKSNTSQCYDSEPSEGVNVTANLPALLTTKSVALY